MASQINSYNEIILNKRQSMIDEAEWLDLLSVQKKLDFYFNVTIPAAIQEGLVPEHTLFYCSYPRLRQKIVEEILLHWKGRKLNILDSSEGEVVAGLSSFQDQGIIFTELYQVKVKEKISSLLHTAMTRRGVEIPFGKSGKSIFFDLQPFCLCVFAENRFDVPESIVNDFETVISIDESVSDRLCYIETKATVKECHGNLPIDVLSYIAKVSNGDTGRCHVITKRFLDYLLVLNISYSELNVKTAERIMSDILHQ